MKRLSPEERKYILHQTVVRLQKEWVCRYGQWNTAKLLRELRRVLQTTNQGGSPEAPGAREPVAAGAQENLTLFDAAPA